MASSTGSWREQRPELGVPFEELPGVWGFSITIVGWCGGEGKLCREPQIPPLELQMSLSGPLSIAYKGGPEGGGKDPGLGAAAWALVPAPPLTTCVGNSFLFLCLSFSFCKKRSKTV